MHFGFNNPSSNLHRFRVTAIYFGEKVNGTHCRTFHCFCKFDLQMLNVLLNIFCRICNDSYYVARKLKILTWVASFGKLTFGKIVCKGFPTTFSSLQRNTFSAAVSMSKINEESLETRIWKINRSTRERKFKFRED